jgi:EAL domain-containing protein (putative c-di-GMP-specific phosphodiesterase class I)
VLLQHREMPASPVKFCNRPTTDRVRPPSSALPNATFKAMKPETAHWTDPVAYLRQALAQDYFALYCQPIAALTGIVVYPMAEVLIRLCEEEKALLPPGEFLPILEHYGMMPELDRWVVREALRRLSSGPEIPRFTVNLSAQTIADPEFPDFLANEIVATGVPADCVVLEIDESDALALPNYIRRFTAKVGSLGAGVLIDGFGRAQNHSAVLELPCVQFIKVHGSLTRRLATDEAAAAKMSALLRLTSELSVEVIAESVEDLEVLARLKTMKVRYAQGFGICRPQSIDLVSELPVMRFSDRRVDDSTFNAVQGLLDLGIRQPEDGARSAAA